MTNTLNTTAANSTTAHADDGFYDPTMDKVLAVIYFAMALSVLTLNSLEVSYWGRGESKLGIGNGDVFLLYLNQLEVSQQLDTLFIFNILWKLPHSFVLAQPNINISILE